MVRSNILFIVALCLIIAVAKINGQCNPVCAQYSGYSCCQNDNLYCCPLNYPVCCGNQGYCCPAGYRCAGNYYCISLVRSLGDKPKVFAVAAIGKTAKLEQ